MSVPACIAVVAGSLIVWSSVSGVVAALLGRAIARRDKTEHPPPPVRRDWPDESPFDLQGFDLDARFYAVLAPSFREYH